MGWTPSGRSGGGDALGTVGGSIVLVSYPFSLQQSGR